MKHTIQNKGFSTQKYVTFCGMYSRVNIPQSQLLHTSHILYFHFQVGKNFPCTLTKDVSWSPMPPYENSTQYQEIADYTAATPWDSNVAYDAQK